MARPSAAHALLREATAADHARVDDSFANGLHDAASYHRYLQGMHALLDALAKSDSLLAAEFAAHRAYIVDDLAALNLAAPESTTSLKIDDEHARLGARYVIEGSALGARMLQRQAHALGYSPDRGAAFLAYHVERGTTHWPRLMQALAQHDPTSPSFHRLLITARATFTLAASCFDPMGSTT